MRNYRPVAYLGLFLSLVALAVVFAWILVRFGAPRPVLVEVGAASDFLAGQEPRLFGADNVYFYVMNFNGELIAVAARSEHRGSCQVRWNVERSKFIDPCPGTHFFPQGAYAGVGPPRELRRFPVEVRDGRVWVNLGYR